MSNIHPFDRAKEFPNYFEIMLKSVPEGERDAFVKKIQKLIEQNISTIVKRLKLYYVYKKDESDPGELSTADYFNELVKSMEHALKESPAKDDYNLEVYLSGGVVRTLLGYVYRQLHTNIQEVFEDEFEAAKKSTEPDQAKQQALENVFKREAFLKTFTETPEFWLQKLKMEQSKLQNSYVLGVGSDMDILYKLSPRTVRSESKLNGAQLEKLHEVLWHENALNNTQKKALYKAVKEQTLNEAQLKDLQKAIKNQYQLYEEELQGLQQAIEATKKLDKEQLDEAQSQALSDTEKTARKQYELHRQELQDLEQAIDNLHKLPERALKESQELYETIKELMETDKKRLENLDQAIKNGGALDLDKKQWKILKQAINNLGNLTGKELKELQKAIYDKSPLTQEQQQVLDLAIKNQHKLNNEQWGNLKQAIQSGSELNTEQLQKLHRAINIQSKLKLKGIKEKVQAAGDLFINSAANFFNLSDVEETLKNSLLPPGDVNEYTKQTTSSMSQGGSALDWLAFEISPKTGRKLIEPPSDLKQQAQMSESIVEGFIRGHFEYLEPQIAETTARRTASIVRGLRALFEIPFLKIKDEAVILREMQDMENLATRDDQGNIILPPRTPKQLEKLRRNTPFEGAYNRATRPDPESTVLSTFLGISKQFAPAADGRMNVHFPKYVQSVKALDKTPASGLYQAAIDSLLVNKETFEEHFTDAGTLYHGTPLNAVTAIIRGGFYISDSTQGAAIYGSGLYSSKDRAVALGYGDGASVLPLHIDPKAKIINLDTMDPQLLEDLKAEAKKDGFLDVKGEAEVNELLKTRYNIDVIINTHVIIQNSAVIKPIQLSDLSVTYGAQFETQFMSNVQLGDKSFRLISENINLTTANKFFEHYTNLCLLSGTVETDSLSPVKIIRNLVTNVEQIENTQPTFKSHNTQLFIYTHCFSAKPDYVMAHLTDIFKYSNNNPDIMKALEKFTQGFATSFKKGNKEEHETLVAILKNLILYSNTNDLIIGTLNELKRIEPQELIGALNALIFSAEITQTQALYFLAKIDDEALQKNYLTLFDLEKPENNKRLAELSAVRALTIEEIYKQHPKEIFENVNLQDAQGNTYLLHSCSTGTDADVHKISKLHADLNFFDKNGKTALWMAIENKNITDECIIEMIQNSIVDLNYVYNNETAILSACTAKRDTLVAYLLSNHAINLNIKKQGLNILHLASQNGLEKTIPLLLNKHSNMFNLNQLDNSLNTPLMLAIESAQHEVIKMLFELQATTKISIDLELKNNLGLSALDIAAQKGDKKLIEYLFTEQRKRGLEYSADALGSALIHAILNKREGAAEILLSTLPAPNLSYRNTNGLTSLTAAVEGKQLTVALTIVQKSEQPIDSDYRNNILESVYILKRQNNDNNHISSILFMLMLEKKYKDADGKTLKLASQEGDIDSVKNMIEQLQYQRKDFLNAILSATTSSIFSKSNVMKNNTALYLLDHLNKIDPSNINLQEQLILSQILLNAVENNSIDIVNKLLDNYKFDTRDLEEALNKALEKNSDWQGGRTTDAETTELLRSILTRYEVKNIADSLNIYPTLMYACEKGIIDIVTGLLEKNVDPNQMFRGETPLLAALSGGHRDIALLLIQAGTINFDMRYKHNGGDGDNALERAVRKSDIDMVKQMLAKIQELNIEMYNDLKHFEAAVQLACESGKLELIDLILDSDLYKNKKDPLRLERVISSFYDSSKHNPERRTTVITHLLKREFTLPPSLYHSAIKDLEADVLLSIFETRKEYIPNDPKKGFEFLETIKIEFFNHEQKTKAQNIIFTLLDKGYLNLAIIEDYLNKKNNGSWQFREYNLIMNIFNNIELQDLKNYPSLISNLAHRESFDKYLSYKTPEQLAEIRKPYEKFMRLFTTGTEADIRDMLTSNTDLNFTDKNGKTTLWMLIENKNLTDKCIIAMLQNSNVRGSEYSTDALGSAVIQAILNKREDMVLYLLNLVKERDPKNIAPTILNKVFINAAKDGSVDIINKLLDIYTVNEQVLTQALSAASDAGHNEVVLFLLNLINQNKTVIGNIDDMVLNTVFINTCSHSFYNVDLAVINQLLSTHRFTSEVLTQAATKARANGNWGILFDLFIENKIDLKNIDPKILESDLTTEAESRYPDIKFVNKLFSAYQFNNQALTSALSNIFYRQNYDMFLLLLDKIDLKNIDPSALKDIITSATQSSDFRFIRSLLTTCKFNEQILTQALNAASNIRYSSKNDRVLYLLGLLNENNIELKNIDFGVLNKIIITAVEYNDLDFIRSLLTACNFNEQILTKILNAASDIKHSGKNKMVPYLLDLINKNKIELKSIDSAILHKIFTNAVEDGSIELTNKLLEQYKFSDNFLHETLGKKLQSIPWGNKITEEIVLSILNAYEFKDSADFVRPSPYPLFHGSGNFNGSLLEFACCNKMENLALALLERKPDLNHNLRQTQKSALIYACENGLKEVVVKMIEQKAQLDQIVVDYEPVVGYTFVSREEVQKTPLIAALNSGHPDIALLLIQAGAKNFNVQWDKQSEQYYQFYWLPDNALDIAIKKGYIDVAKEIIKKAEEQGIKVYAKLRNFQHTVNITCQLGNLELIDLVINSNLYDNSLRLENIIEDIYDLLKSHPYTDNSERKANNVLTHLLERPFVCPEPLYEAVIKHLDAEILLKIFETRKEYAPDNDEKKVALLKQLDMSHNNMGWRGDKIRDTKYLTTILALLEKGYLDLNTIENSNYCTRMLGAHLKTTHLNSHPKLAMALAKHESFDQYLTPEVCERLITIRKSLPQEDIVHIHFQSHLEKERAKPKGNESQGDHSNTQKPD